jgi:hypothetical protein
VGFLHPIRQFASVCTLAPALAVEVHRALDEREEGVVATDADVAAGVEARAALPDDDAAGLDGLPAEKLHAQSLTVRVAAVAAGALTLFVCHCSPLTGETIYAPLPASGRGENHAVSLLRRLLSTWAPAGRVILRLEPR